MCIMEALGGLNTADPFHVSSSSVLDKEQPVAEMFSENKSHVTSCRAAGGHSLLEDLSLLSAYHSAPHKELFIWVSQRDGESVCPL